MQLAKVVVCKMSPNLKLVYFDGRGVVEGTRFILKQGGIEFEDVRIKHEDWPKYKDSKLYFKAKLQI